MLSCSKAICLHPADGWLMWVYRAATWWMEQTIAALLYVPPVLLVLGWVTVFGRVYHQYTSMLAGIPPRYVTKPTRSTQPCIPLGSLNRVPALIGWGNGGNVTSARWRVTLCDPIWHVSSRSGAVLVAQTAIRFLTLPYCRMGHLWFCCVQEATGRADKRPGEETGRASRDTQ